LSNSISLFLNHWDAAELHWPRSSNRQRQKGLGAILRRSDRRAERGKYETWPRGGPTWARSQLCRKKDRGKQKPPPPPPPNKPKPSKHPQHPKQRQPPPRNNTAQPKPQKQERTPPQTKRNPQPPPHPHGPEKKTPNTRTKQVES